MKPGSSPTPSVSLVSGYVRPGRKWAEEMAGGRAGFYGHVTFLRSITEQMIPNSEPGKN